MKKTTMLLMLLCVAGFGFAQWQNRNNKEIGGPAGNFGNKDRNYPAQTGTLIVNAAFNRPFTVTVDNIQTYQSNPNTYGSQNNIRMDNIYAGNHQIEVYEWKKGLFGRTKKYLLYSGNIYVKQGIEVTVQLNGYGQPVITERQINNRNNNNNKWNKRKKDKRNNHCDNDDDDRRYNDKDRRNRDNS